MVKNCIVHIGMYKTGSSSIQHFLYKYLDDDRFEYAGFGERNQSLILQAIFSDHPKRVLGKIKRRRKYPGAEDIIEEKKTCMLKALQACKADAVIFSGEGICALNQDTEMQRFKEFLHANFETIRIIGYVRTPASFMESAFQQRVKGGHIRSFDLYKLFPYYRNRFEKFDTVFGRNSVDLYKYDRMEFTDGNVVNDFCMKTGIKLPQTSVKSVNQSLCKEAIALLYVYNKYRNELETKQQNRPKQVKIVKILRKLGSERLHFSPKIITPVIESQQEDIQWMENRLGVLLEEKIDDASDAITSEDDLIEIAMTASDRFRELCHNEYGLDPGKCSSDREIAMLVHDLIVKLSDENKAKNMT